MNTRLIDTSSVKQVNYKLFPMFLVLYEIALYLSSDAYLPAMPIIAEHFSVQISLLQLTLSAWFFGAIVGQFLIAPLVDRFGRKPVLLFGGGLYIIAAFACALSTTVEALILARVLQGIAIPSMTIAGYASINEYFNNQQVTKILANMNSIKILAPTLGPLFGAMILTYFNWHWIFIVLAIWAMITLILLYFYMPETHSINLRAKSINLTQVMQDCRALLSNQRYMLNVICSCCLVITMIAWLVSGPFLIIKHFAYSPLQYGLIQLIIFSCFIIGNQLLKVCSAHYHKLKIISYAVTTSLLVSVIILILNTVLPNQLSIIIILMMLLSLLCGIAMPILFQTTIQSSQQPMPLRIAILSACKMLGAVLGSALVSIFSIQSITSLIIFITLFLTIAFLSRLVGYKSSILNLIGGSA